MSNFKCKECGKRYTKQIDCCRACGCNEIIEEKDRFFYYTYVNFNGNIDYDKYIGKDFPIFSDILPNGAILIAITEMPDFETLKTYL